MFLQNCHQDFLIFHLLSKLKSIGFQFLFLSSTALRSRQLTSFSLLLLILFYLVSVVAIQSLAFCLPPASISFHVVARENLNNPDMPPYPVAQHCTLSHSKVTYTLLKNEQTMFRFSFESLFLVLLTVYVRVLTKDRGNAWRRIC